MTTAIASQFAPSASDFFTSFLAKENSSTSLFENNSKNDLSKNTKIDLEENTSKEEDGKDSSFISKIKNFFTSYIKDVKDCFRAINEFLNKPEKYEIDYKRHYNPKDKEITCIEQGNIGDCWYLSTVQSMSYTRLGREIISDSIGLGENTNTFTTPYKEYEISDSEIESAKRGSYYSSGDEDALILELGAEKFFTDVANKDSATSDYSKDSMVPPEEFKYRLEEGENVLEGGFPFDAYKVFSNCSVDEEKDYERKNQALSDFQNCDNIVGACGAITTVKGKDFLDGLNENLGTGYVTDVNGRKIGVCDRHDYAIKKVQGDKVTFVNPWDTDIEVTISREDALKLFDYITIAYMPEENE